MHGSGKTGALDVRHRFTAMASICVALLAGCAITPSAEVISKDFASVSDTRDVSAELREKVSETGSSPAPADSANPAPSVPATEEVRESAPSPSSPSRTTTGSATPPLMPQPAPIVMPVCPSAISGNTPGAPSRTSSLGVAGTESADLQSFAVKLNEIRVANCLPPVPFENIRYDSCMEDRLFWMAEDPSTDPMSAWGHIGSVRSDGLPSVGCDGNLAGGSGNTGATVAQKWWDSSGHRASLYKPTYTGGMGGVCILFAMTHGGVPNESYSFTRAAARWVSC